MPLMESRETITPDDEAHWLEMRKQDITSTECAALFGFSPYQTKFELWHTKIGNFESQFISNERVEWGRRLEESIAVGAGEEHGWIVEPFKDYGRLPEHYIGSSFDFRILEPADDAGLLEVKNLDSRIFREGWILDSGQLEAPPHIELQVQHEMLVSGDDRNTIAGLVGGNDLKIIRREADYEIQQIILDRVGQFWDSIDAGIEPDPTFPPDSKFIAKLFGFARTGSLEDMTGDPRILDYCQQYVTVAKEKSAADRLQKELKAKILLYIGDTEKVTANRFTISAGMVGPAHIEFDRNPFRNFRVSERKEK